MRQTGPDIPMRLYEMILPLIQGLKLTLHYFFSKKVTLNTG
jgi:hypothetical protein